MSEIDPTQDFMVVIQYSDINTVKVQTYTKFIKTRTIVSTDVTGHVAARIAMEMFRQDYSQDEFFIVSIHVVPSLDLSIINQTEFENTRKYS